MSDITFKPIGHIETDFKSKFGIPRQSGLVKDLKARVVLEKEYRVREAFRGLEDFSRIWLIWEFSEAAREGGEWSPTVRPPRLGGNKRMGVFATRSPFRPNPIGLSCVELERIDFDCPDGPVLYVSGADLMDGTPIFDIKPYIPYADSFPDAGAGFAAERPEELNVVIPDELREKVKADKLSALVGVLSEDPRPHYQKDAARVYGLSFGGMEVKFTVDGDTLTVTSVEEENNEL